MSRILDEDNVQMETTPTQFSIEQSKAISMLKQWRKRCLAFSIATWNVFNISPLILTSISFLRVSSLSLTTEDMSCEQLCQEFQAIQASILTEIAGNNYLPPSSLYSWKLLRKSSFQNVLSYQASSWHDNVFSITTWGVSLTLSYLDTFLISKTKSLYNIHIN